MFSNFFLTNSIAFIIVLLIIVVVHEYGHYLFARLCGVQVEIFSVGFGRTLLSCIDKNKTKWQIALWPLGGFVKIKGQEASFDEEELKKIDKNDKTNFTNKNPLQKSLIVIGGPAFNIVLAFLLFFIIFFSYGKPDPQPIVNEILKNSPAEIGGLQKNDKILAINDNKINSFIDLTNNLNKLKDYNIKIEIERENNIQNIELILNQDKKLGITVKSSEKFIQISLKEAVNSSIIYTYDIIKATTIGLKQLIVGKEKLQNLGGLIQIAKSSGDAINHGLKAFLFLIAILSINLAIINLIPIPGLDGGYLLFYILDMLWIGKFITPKIRGYSVVFGFGILIFVMLFANFNDIFKMISR